jgi:ketosteroid isomerase-like protein
MGGEAMKKAALLLCFIIMLCIAFGCRNQAKDLEEVGIPIFNVEADKEAIKVLVDHFFASHETGDLEGLMAIFSDDAIFMPDDAETINKIVARERFAPYLELFHLKVNYSIDEIEVSGDLGFVRCSYLVNAVPKAEGERMSHNGKFIFVLKRQSDNTWRSSHFIWNSNNTPHE